MNEQENSTSDFESQQSSSAFRSEPESRQDAPHDFSPEPVNSDQSAPEQPVPEKVVEPPVVSSSPPPAELAPSAPTASAPAQAPGSGVPPTERREHHPNRFRGNQRNPRGQGRPRQDQRQRGNQRQDNVQQPDRQQQERERPEEQRQEQFQPRQRPQFQDRERGRQGGGRSPERDNDRILHGSDLSIIVPLYNEEQSLRELYDKIRNIVGRHGHYEIIFVDDGSTDGSARVLQELRNRDHRIKIIRFRRNFGKSSALAAAFQLAKGDIIITMDADLQDDPAEIPNLVNEIKKGFDLVSGWKKKRFDPVSKTIPSRFFNFVTSAMTGIKIHDFNCGLKAYRRDVVKDVKLYGELHRYIPVLAHWKGFKVGEVAVQHHPRKYGKTKFGIGRFWKGFLDLLGVLFTTRYMQRPLHLFGFWGIVCFFLGFVADAYLVVEKFVHDVPLTNRPLFTGGVLLIIVGIQLISIGLIGELITKTRQENSSDYSIREIWK